MKTTNIKRDKIIFWIPTALLALFELSGAFFMNSQIAIEGMHHLGLPNWFRWEVSIGHLIGGILLVVPVNRKIKEWMYVAFGIDFLSAFVAYVTIDGLVFNTFSPLISLALLVVSYVYYHKLQNAKSGYYNLKLSTV